jgi:hypothetical protein
MFRYCWQFRILGCGVYRRSCLVLWSRENGAMGVELYALLFAPILCAAPRVIVLTAGVRDFMNAAAPVE